MEIMIIGGQIINVNPNKVKVNIFEFYVTLFEKSDTEVTLQRLPKMKRKTVVVIPDYYPSEEKHTLKPEKQIFLPGFIQNDPRLKYINTTTAKYRIFKDNEGNVKKIYLKFKPIKLEPAGLN